MRGKGQGRRERTKRKTYMKGEGQNSGERTERVTDIRGKERGVTESRREN